MRVILLTSLFYPEIGANAKRMTHLAEDLQKRGDEVIVVTAFPYYTNKTLPQEYKGKFISLESYKGIKVIRTFTYLPSSKTPLRRLLTFSSFMLSSVFALLYLKGRYDLLITISPPLFSGVSAFIISRLKRIPFIFDLQDIYPETAVSLGVLKDGFTLSLAQGLERFIYRKAEAISVISSGFKDNLRKKGVPDRKVHIIPNWVDIELFNPEFKDDLSAGSPVYRASGRERTAEAGPSAGLAAEAGKIRKELNLDNKFVVMFAGNLGLAQGLQTLVKCAKLLRENKDIEFVFVGEGVERENLVNLIKKYSLSNLRFISGQPNKKMPAYLSLANVCLAHLRRGEIWKMTIPSKIYEYMAMGKPIIIGVDGEAKRLIESANCGVYVQPEDPERLSKAILKLYKDKQLCFEYGKRGRSYVRKNYSRRKIVDEYISVVTKIGGRE